jgi:hypothetical protein
MRYTSKNRKSNKKGGNGGASGYGSYVWGMDQTNNPAQGNAIQVTNNPLSIPIHRGGKKGANIKKDVNIKKGGDANTDLMDKMNKPQIPDFIQTQSVSPVINTPTSITTPSTTTPVTGGSLRTRRKKRHIRKSKRIYR